MTSSLGGIRIIVSGAILLSFLFSGCVTRGASSTEPADMTTEVPHTPVIESTPAPTAVATESPVTAEPTVEAITPANSDPTPEPTTSWLDLYEPVFENYRAVADADLSKPDYDYSKDTYGVMESWDMTTWQDVTYGYTLHDLDGNGIPELIVGNMASADDNIVHALFTLVDGQPRKVFCSITRGSYWLSITGGIYGHGSGGAMLSDFMIYSYNGTDISPQYGYFTSGGVENGGYDYGFFRVTNGDRYTGTVERISQDEFTEGLNNLETTILPLDDLSLIWIY